MRTLMDKEEGEVQEIIPQESVPEVPIRPEDQHNEPEPVAADKRNEPSLAAAETPPSRSIEQPAVIDTRPWTGRGEVRSSLKNSAPLGTAENPLVVGVESEEL
jgi:hypothetical protein